MPGFLLEVTGGTDRLPVTGFHIIDESHIFGASVRVQRGSTTSGRTHVLVGVYRGLPAEENIFTMLIDDYVFGAHVPTFTGRFPTFEGDGVLLVVRSADAPTIRLATQNQKFDP